MSKEKLRMQRLAGLITESVFKEEIENVDNTNGSSKVEDGMEMSSEEAVNKAMSVVDKLNSSPQINSLADKIANNPDLVKQLKDLVTSNGVNINENETNNSFDKNDIRKLALSFSEKEINKENNLQENDEDYDGGDAASVFLGAFGGGAIGASLSSTIIAAIPGIASLFAGPAILGAIAGVALGILASKVYEKFKNKNNANNSEILRNNLINTLIKANIFKPESNNKEYLNKFDTATLQKTHDKYINV